MLLEDCMAGVLLEDLAAGVLAVDAGLSRRMAEAASSLEDLRCVPELKVGNSDED